MFGWIELKRDTNINIEFSQVDDPLIHAKLMRALAEQGADSTLYEQAAVEFTALNMEAAALRCRDRANEYRKDRL